MSNRGKIKGKQNLRYNMTIWSKNDAFDILNDISENVILVKLTIIIVGNWIFDINYKKVLCLTQVLMDIIFSPSIGK